MLNKIIKLSVRAKIIVYFLFVLFIIFSVGWYSYINLEKISNFLRGDLPESILRVQSDSKLDTIVQFIRYDDEVLTQSARNYAFTGDIYWKDRYFDFSEKIGQRISEAKMLSGEYRYHEIFEALESINSSLVKIEEKSFGYVDNGNLDSAVSLLDSSEYLDLKKEYEDRINEYLNFRGASLYSAEAVSVEELKKIETLLDSSVSHQQKISLAILALLILSFLVLFIAINKAFLRPLIEMQRVAKEIASGDLSKRVDIKTGDEIEDLADDFNMMISRLEEIIKNFDQRVKEQLEEVNRKTEDLENQNKAVLNILEDVDIERKKSEKLAQDLEKFKLAVDNASDQIVITDSEGIILFANKVVEKITGYMLKDVIGKKAGKMWSRPMEKEFYEKLWKTIKINKKPFVGEIINKRKNGEEYQAYISISPIVDKNDEVLFFVGIERDITLEKNIDKTKTEFVSLASHQLRTPLSAIGWYAEMLLAGDAGKINKNQKEYLNEIYKGNKRMVSLVNALLNVSRLELGTFSVNPSPTDIREVSNDVLKELEVKIKEKKISVKKKYDKDIKKINVDPNLMRIVFQNLLSNSVKYNSDKGKVEVSIWNDYKKKKINISVKDNGWGIPSNQKDKIFDKLFRADNVKQKDVEGTGLGMYIVKSIIDSTGGKIWLESKEGEGSTFYVELPLSGMKSKTGTKALS